MHNLHTSRYKREKRQPQAIEDEQLQAVAQSTDEAAIAGNLWDGMDQQLVRAIESLPPEYATVMMLWAVDELSYKEIAESLDVPIGTVMSRLFRARQRLAEQLREYAAKEGITKGVSTPASEGHGGRQGVVSH
jgi:RNA polymerase sigma-70 factor (ECF subfamily)